MTTGTGEVAMRCRDCGREAPADGPQYCGWCFAAVEVVLAPIDDPASLPARVEAGPATLARWAPLLPDGLALDAVTSGLTPARPAPALGAAIGVPGLWVKDETANPTGSFKDRVVEVAVARGVALGARGVACSSTGNLARAVAAAAARRGVSSLLVVPDDLAVERRDALVAGGATVVAVRGGYDAASRLAAEAAADLVEWAWVNVTLRPWYELGARTVGWEIVEQLGWRVPDRVVVPVASGALARAVHESISQLVDAGVVSGPVPRLVATQPAGCDTLASSFASGSDQVRPLRTVATVAPALAMGDPPDGPAVLSAARATGGAVVAAAEEDIDAAARLVLETEGIAVEPAGGVVVAALRDLAASGVVDPAEVVVAVLTGAPSSTAPTAVVPGGALAGTIDPAIGELLAVLGVDPPR
ncbi:MAG: threonine synthase [Acidimicrobiales bacterium]